MDPEDREERRGGSPASGREARQDVGERVAQRAPDRPRRRVRATGSAERLVSDGVQHARPIVVAMADEPRVRPAQQRFARDAIGRERTHPAPRCGDARVADDVEVIERRRGLRAGDEPQAALARARIAVADASGDVSGTDGAPDDRNVRELPAQSERDLARAYGPSFAEAVFHTAPGTWSAPLATTSGRVRVLVREHEPPRTPPLSDVRNQVRDLVRRERAAAEVRRALDELRRGYAVSSSGDSADRPG